MYVPGTERVQEKTRPYCQDGPLEALLYDLSRSEKWYDHQLDGVVGNERCKILWDMNIQCDHVIEARRPDIVVVDKENNKVIIVDIASPWDHRVYEKEGEKTEKCQDSKREIGKLWGNRQQQVIPVVVGALGAVSKRLATWLDKLGLPLGRDCCGTQRYWEQQKP